MTKDTISTVDAHHHLWDPNTGHYAFLTDEVSAIRRPFAPEDLQPELERHGVDLTVVVQARPDEEETLELLETAKATHFIGGVVGWTDLTAPDVADRLARLRAAPGGHRLCGIRHQVHDEADPEWLLRDDVGRGLQAVADANLAYDVLVRTRELPSAIDVARHFPDLRFVIDHVAKPPIASGDLQIWREVLRPLGELENVTCKLSGMVTEAHWNEWSSTELTPVVHTALDVFGPARLMFGSDWPVCLLAASYSDVFSALEQSLGDLSADERDAVYGITAIETYGLDR